MLLNKTAANGVITNEKYEYYMKLIKEFENELSKPQAEMDKFIEEHNSNMQPKFDKKVRQEVKKELKQ